MVLISSVFKSTVYGILPTNRDWSPLWITTLLIDWLYIYLLSDIPLTNTL